MARRATAIKDARQEDGRTVLVLDAGDTLLGQTVALKTEGAAIVEAMNAMGYDAMAVGRLDLSKGVDVLTRRAQEARFAILSANLVRKGTEELILPASTIIERDGVRYGILGVTEPQAVQAPGAAEAIEVLDPTQAVRAALPDLRARSDVVVALSHLGINEDLALAEAVPGIDIIIGGRSRQLMQAPEVVGDTIVTQMGFDGEYLGRLDVTVNEDGHLSGPAGTMIMLTPDYADDPELAALVARYKRQYAEPTPSTS